MHMTVLVELPAETPFTAERIEKAVAKAMEPFFSDCSNPLTVEQQREYVEDYGEEEARPLCTEHRGHKWDWYQIGGRWRDFFQPVPGVTELMHGSPGVPEQMAIDQKEAVLTITGADVLRKRDIDWERMAAKRRADAEEAWAEAEKRHPGDGMMRHLVYDIQQGETREQYIERQSKSEPSTYAVLTADGEWVPRETYIYSREKGKPGHFDRVEDWDRRWADMVAAMPDDAILAVVDYHN